MAHLSPCEQVFIYWSAHVQAPAMTSQKDRPAPHITRNFFALSAGTALAIVALVLIRDPHTWTHAWAPTLQDRSSSTAPNIFLVANNRAANATWRGMRVGLHDLVLMFNMPLPLHDLESAVPLEQKILFANAAVIMQMRLHKANLTTLASAFERLVALNDESEDRYVTIRKENLPVFARFRHVQILDRVAFIDGLQARFPRYRPAHGKRPSSGFLALHYALAYFPMYKPVLVGFTGKGVSRHNFTLEQQQYKTLGVTMI